MKYSLSEIDRMRVALRIIHNIGGTDHSIVSRHEEYLRTYMLNGTTPEELETQANALEQQRRDESFQRYRFAPRVRVYEDGRRETLAVPPDGWPMQ
jgi:hypothetical protein